MKRRAMNFEKNSLLLLAFSLTSSFCNYLFQIATGQMLSEADYGTMNTLLSLVVILSVPTAFFTVVSSKFTTNYLTLGKQDIAATWILKLEKAALLCALVMLAAGALLSGAVGNALQIEDRWYVFTAFGVAAANYLSCPAVGALQGAKRFARYGVANLIAAGMKLLGSVALILAGLRIYGTMFAIAAGTLATTAFAFVSIRNMLVSAQKDLRVSTDGEIRRYLSGALIIQFISAILSNGDMLLIKAFSSTAAEAGVYSSAMVIGKIPLYIAGALVVVLFPTVSEAAAKKEATLRLFLKSLAYGVSIAVAFAIFLQLFGTFVLKIMYGERYLSALPLLLPVSVFIVFVTGITIEINYFLALGKTRFFIITQLSGFLAAFIAVSFNHESARRMLYVISIALAAVFAVNCAYAFAIRPKLE